jgi:hypothetical protein
MSDIENGETEKEVRTRELAHPVFVCRKLHDHFSGRQSDWEMGLERCSSWDCTIKLLEGRMGFKSNPSSWLCCELRPGWQGSFESNKMKFGFNQNQGLLALSDSLVLLRTGSVDGVGAVKNETTEMDLRESWRSREALCRRMLRPSLRARTHKSPEKVCFWLEMSTLDGSPKGRAETSNWWF